MKHNVYGNTEGIRDALLAITAVTAATALLALAAGYPIL
jgi:hypothetical protein